MATISLCMIVRDEEPVLARCLSCARPFVDEIIIVDTGSQDRTVEIARQFTDQIYHFPWTDDFSSARNFSFSKATMDYQMWLDADDVISPEDQDALQILKQDLTVDVVMLPYHTAFDSAGNPVFTYYRERILRRSRHFLWSGAVHEAITPTGEILYAEPAVLHRKLTVNDPDRNLNIFRNMLKSQKSLSTRDQFYYARELFYHQNYTEAIRFYLEFLAQPDAWLEDQITACQQLADCYLQSGETDSALQALYRSFLYDSPRAEVCCAIGNIRLGQKQYQDAVFWYESALRIPLQSGNPGFSQPDCHDYIPYMQLCVCHDRLGNISQAEAYNEKAGRIKPGDAGYLYNRSYFQERRNRN